MSSALADPVAATVAADAAELSEARAYYNLCSLAADHTNAVVHPQRVGSGVVLRMPRAADELIFNRVIGLGVGEPASTAQLDSIFALFKADGTDRAFGIDLAPVAQPQHLLREQLRQRRLRRAMRAKVMLVRDAAMPVPELHDWSRVTGLAVRRVDAGTAAARTVAQLSCRNFAVDPAIEEVLFAGTAGAGWRLWLVLDGSRPIGAALSYLDDGMGWLGWTSVNAEARGRGAHAGLVIAALADAAESRCRAVTTETAAGTPERPDHALLNMLKFGFREVGRRPTYLYAPRALTASVAPAPEPAAVFAK